MKRTLIHNNQLLVFFGLLATTLLLVMAYKSFIRNPIIEGAKNRKKSKPKKKSKSKPKPKPFKKAAKVVGKGINKAANTVSKGISKAAEAAKKAADAARQRLRDQTEKASELGKTVGNVRNDLNNVVKSVGTLSKQVTGIPNVVKKEVGSVVGIFRKTADDVKRSISKGFALPTKYIIAAIDKSLGTKAIRRAFEGMRNARNVNTTRNASNRFLLRTNIRTTGRVRPQPRSRAGTWY